MYNIHVLQNIINIEYVLYLSDKYYKNNIVNTYNNNIVRKSGHPNKIKVFILSSLSKNLNILCYLPIIKCAMLVFVNNSQKTIIILYNVKI